MGGPELSGIGFAIGVERLAILCNAEGIFDEFNVYKEVHPTFLYESICTLGIFILLRIMQKNKKIDNHGGQRPPEWIATKSSPQHSSQNIDFIL